MLEKFLKFLKDQKIDLDEEQKKALESVISESSEEKKEGSEEPFFQKFLNSLNSKKADEPTQKTDSGIAELRALFEEVSNKLTESENGRKKLESEIENFKKNSKSASIKNWLKDAVAKGKITAEAGKYSDNESEKGIWQKRLEKDSDEFKAALDELPENPDVNKKDKGSEGKNDGKTAKKQSIIAGAVGGDISKYIDESFKSKTN